MSHQMAVLRVQGQVYCNCTCKAGHDAYTIGPWQIGTAASVAMLAGWMLQAMLHVWKIPCRCGLPLGACANGADLLWK